MKKYLISYLIFSVYIMFPLFVGASNLNLYEQKLIDWGYRPYFFDFCIGDVNVDFCSISQEKLPENSDYKGSPIVDSGAPINFVKESLSFLDDEKYEDEKKPIDVEKLRMGEGLIILSSYLQQTDADFYSLSEGFKNIFLICDNTYSYSINTSCSSFGVSTPENVYVDLGTDSRGNKLGFSYIYEGGKNIYIIPDLLLTVPAYSNRVNEYFKYSPEDVVVSIEEGGVNPHLEVSKSLVEFFLYLLIALTFVLILYTFLIQGVSKKTLEQYLFKIYAVTDSALKKYQIFVINLLILIAVVIFSLLVAVTLVDKTTFSLNYLKDFIFFSVSLDGLKSSIVNKNLINLTFLFLSVGFVTLFASLFLTNLLDLLKNYFSVIKKAHINRGSSFIIYLHPFLIILAMVSVAISIDSYVLVILIIFLLIFIAIYFYRDNFTLSERISPRPKLALILFASVILVFTPFLSKKTSQSSVVSPEDLIGVRSEIVTTPYIKDYTDPVIFNEHIFNPVGKIFIDDYLVYDPNILEIINTPLYDFVDSDNYIIHSNVVKNPLAYLNNDSLLRSVISYIPTNSIFYENSDTIANFEIEFGCDLGQGKSDLDINYTNLSSEGGDRDTIFEFPMCKKTSNRYYIPLFNYYSGPSIFNFISSGGIKIINLEITAGNKLTYFSYLKESGDLMINGGLGSTVYNYSEKIESITFLRKIDQEFNLSDPINTLVKEGYIKSPFRIWSDVPNVVIKNEYLE